MTAATVEFSAGTAPALHVCAIAGDPGWRQRRCASFTLRGLLRGERVLFIDSAANRGPVLQLLRRERLELDRDIREGRVQLRDVPDVYLPGGIFDVDRVSADLVAARDAALADGYCGLRVVGVPGSITPTACDWDRWVSYERRVNEAFADDTLAGMCVYDSASVPTAVADQLSRAHPVIETATDGWVSQEGTAPWVHLAGEIDLCTAAHLELLLSDHQPAGDLHLDLAGLEFVDVAGLRALVTTATRLPPGRRLVVHRSRPVVRRALQAAGWARLESMPIIVSDAEGELP